MTDTERSRIVELQHQGYGYKKISAITGLPLNTVKSFCARHHVQIKEMPDSNALCRNCLTPLEQTPHKRKRMFCSDACRMAWCSEKRTTHSLADIAGSSLKAMATAIGCSAPVTAI